jgi:hypothetical protein
MLTLLYTIKSYSGFKGENALSSFSIPLVKERKTLPSRTPLKEKVEQDLNHFP